MVLEIRPSHLDGWGGIQDHGVVVGGRRAARDLPFQLGVVVGEPALASVDVLTVRMAELRPGQVRKPRLLTLTGYSQAKEKRKTSNIQI